MLRRARPAHAVFAAALLAACALAPALSPAPARAAAPIIQEFDSRFVDPFLSDFCGFPVEVHFHGKLLIQDVNGRQAVKGADYFTTYTNLDNGQTVTERLSGLQLNSAQTAGGVVTLNFSFSGGSKITSAGQQALVNVGRTTQTIVFDAATGEILSFDSGFVGRSSDPLTLELLCEWLSD